MKFHTEIEIDRFPQQIDHNSPVMMLGSCFSENIGQKLEDQKFDTDINPFGILYNPASLSASLRRLMQAQPFSHAELFFDQGQWNSFMHHSRFSGIDADHVLQGINQRLISSSEFLKKARFLILTFGTSWVYRLKKDNQIVSNCHKIPAREFIRERLSVQEIVSDYKNLIRELKNFNPALNIIFTVSPVRHWKDGATENQRSKASLLLAIDEIQNCDQPNSCSYFPAYEIMMDELRDYRFYTADMLHPNDIAVEYIFNKFRDAVISEQSIALVKEILKIRQAFAHRPFNPASEEYRKFLTHNLREIDRLTKSFPFLNFEKEKTHFEQQFRYFDQNEIK